MSPRTAPPDSRALVIRVKKSDAERWRKLQESSGMAAIALFGALLDGGELAVASRMRRLADELEARNGSQP